MSTTQDRYRAELDRLTFSQEAKERMQRRLQKTEGARHAQGVQSSQLTLIDRAQPQATSRSKPRDRRAWLRAAAVVIGIVVALAGGTGMAVAAGVVPPPSEVLSNLFGSSPAQTEVIDRIGRPVGASATSNGITITADAIIGDAHGYTVVYSISRADGQPLDLSGVTKLDDGTLLLGFDKQFSDVAGAKGMIGSSWFYDADSTDNSIQYIEAVDNITTFDGQGIVGRTVNVHLGDLFEYSDSWEPRSLASGSWDLKFELNYEDASVSLPTGQTFDCNGYDATIEELSVSPVGVHLSYQLPESALYVGDAEDGEELTAEQEDAVDRIYDIHIIVTYANGTTEDLTDSGGQTDDDVVDKRICFAQIHEVGDIASVTIGGMTIPVNQ